MTNPPPFALRITAILCGAVGLHLLIDALGHSIPLLAAHQGPWLPVLTRPVTALLVCAAAILVWLRRRIGALLLVLALALPLATGLFLGRPARAPGMLLMIALAVAANVRQLR